MHDIYQEAAKQIENNAYAHARNIGKAAALGMGYGREFKGETFHVERLSNGYTVFPGLSIHRQATFCSDIPAILAYIARAIGGEDAVPIMPVSPEEAGLIDDSQIDLPFTDRPLCGTDVDGEIEAYVRSLLPSEDDEAMDSEGIARVSAVLRMFGFRSYEYYNQMKDGLMPELKLDLLSHLRGTKDTGKTV